MILIADPVRFVVDLLIFYSIYLLLSISLNVEYGYAGIPNFGKVMFFAAGAFTVGALATKVLAQLLDVPLGPWDFETYNRKYAFDVTQALSHNPLVAVTALIVFLLLGALMGAILGVVASYPAIRLREDYLAITLLVSGELLRVFARNYDPLICGTLGISVPDVYSWLPSGTRSVAQAAVMMGIALSVWLLVERMLRSPFGRLLRAVRDCEVAAMALGKDVAGVRMRALVLGSGIAGLAGALYAFYVGFVHADDYAPIRTFVVWVMVVLGGAGNNAGAALGSLIYVLTERMIAQTKHLFKVPFDVNYLSYIAFGVVLIAMLMYRPQGLLPERPTPTIDFRGYARSPQRCSRGG